MQMRAEFDRNKGVATSGPEFEAMVAGIDEAADMLRHEIVRGNLNEQTGRYGKTVGCDGETCWWTGDSNQEACCC